MSPRLHQPGARSLAAGFALAAAAPARAEGQLDVALRADVPVLVGAGATWEGPHRLRAELTAGYMPPPYVDLTNAAMTGFDVYSDTVAGIIERALQSSLIVHAQAGWRPLPARGLSVSLGYQLIGLGGDSTELSAFSEASDPRLLEAAQGVTGDLEVAVVDHMITAEAGYEWAIQDRWVVGTSLGFGYTLATSSAATPTREAANAFEQEIMDAATASTEDYLAYVFEEWVHLPMVGLSVGYRFP